MTKKTFVFRADDAGCSVSANKAIEDVINAGFIKNVSVMACGPAIEDAARRFHTRDDICFGLHTTINAEWDRIKWRPVSESGKLETLLDENGFFLNDPSKFLVTKPPVEQVMKEVDAQLERLTHLGFDIRYVDSHMLPERYIDGMDEAMRDYIKSKGLIDHMCFYHIPPITGADAQNMQQVMLKLQELEAGQYFWVIHPAYDTPETRNTGNDQYAGEDIARARSQEAAIFSNPDIKETMARIGIEAIRYDQGIPGPRIAALELKL